MKLDIKFQTGVLWQDCQHREWISLLDKLETARAGELNERLFDQAVSTLVMYVNQHFALEEEYMRHYAYPEERFHKEEHRLCILRLKDFRKKYRNYSHEGFLKIIETMTEWMYSHILENDQKLGAFILQKEQAKSPGE